LTFSFYKFAFMFGTVYTLEELHDSEIWSMDYAKTLVEWFRGMVDLYVSMLSSVSRGAELDMIKGISASIKKELDDMVDVAEHTPIYYKRVFTDLNRVNQRFISLQHYAEIKGVKP